MIIPNIWENRKCSKPPTRLSVHDPFERKHITNELSRISLSLSQDHDHFHIQSWGISSFRGSPHAWQHVRRTTCHHPRTAWQGFPGDQRWWYSLWVDFLVYCSWMFITKNSDVHPLRHRIFKALEPEAVPMFAGKAATLRWLNHSI